MLDCIAVDTPIDHNLKLLPNQGYLDLGRYTRLVGLLNYHRMTRPNIAFSVSAVSQFLNSPCDSNWNAVIRIPRYLKGSPEKGLVYTDKGHNDVLGIC